MGKVIEVEADDWYLMRQLRESVKDMRERNPIKYKLAIDTHSNTYKGMLREIIDNG
jgi:hypothetical protein